MPTRHFPGFNSQFLPGFAPKLDWVPPPFPSLRGVKTAAIDLETYDPMIDDGSGCVFGVGHVAGIAVALDNGFRGYWPIGHESRCDNLPKELVCQFTNELIASDIELVFANAQYDIGWLRTLGILIPRLIHDILIRDTLIDEERDEGYDLNAVATRWLGEGKDERLLKEIARDYGYITDKEVKANLWRLPAAAVGPYAEADVDRTLRSFHAQTPEIITQDLGEAYQLERQVLPILEQMWCNGIHVDVDRAAELAVKWKALEVDAMKLLEGVVDPYDTTQVGEYLDRHNIPLKKTWTKHGRLEFSGINKALFTRFSESVPVQNLQRAREINRCRTVFLEKKLIAENRNGKIHPYYVQMHTDEGGTRTMRLSCKNPNAQQFPKRSRYFPAKELRKCLLPPPGFDWAKNDYWSQEPTLQCHYGLMYNMPGAKEVAATFAKKIKLYTFIEERTKGACNYDQAKGVVLGRSYKMGIAKMAATVGVPEKRCAEILEEFDRAVPYIALLADKAEGLARNRGYLRLLCGHRRHFNLWTLPGYSKDEDGEEAERRRPLALDAARKKHGMTELIRAHVRKAFNSLIQGGSAGQTKRALVNLNSAIRTPINQVHDEIGMPVCNRKEAELAKEIQEQAVKLLLPVSCDLEVNHHWV